MNYIEKYKLPILISFFFSFLIVGLLVYGDYGISWDEPIQRHSGYTSAKYVRTLWQKMFDMPVDEKDLIYTPLHQYSDKTYGMVVELILVAFEVVFDLDDSRDIYRLRHLLTFLIFYGGAIFFYLILTRHFNDWKWGLLGCAFLILSPRIFANAFYNSKDLAFMSLYIISLYTLLKFIELKSMRAASVHGLATALLVDTRIVGVFVPALTIMFYTATLAMAPLTMSRIRHMAATLACYLMVAIIGIILFWPFLWENPLANFHEAFVRMSQFPWPGRVTYFGMLIPASQLPWHYIPVWIGMTTPLMYIALFIIGAVSIVYQLLSQFMKSVRCAAWYREALFLCASLLPVIVVIVLSSTLYDGWRQMYFVYPSMILVSVSGLKRLMTFSMQLQSLGRLVATCLIVSMTLFSSYSTLLFMIRNHPHQNVYFNTIGKIKPTNFDLDYWGLSYKQALEYVLSIDNSPKIILVSANPPGYINELILKGQDRKRLKQLPREDIGQAKYYLSNYRWEWEDYKKGRFPYTNEVHKIEVDGIPIVGIYQLRE